MYGASAVSFGEKLYVLGGMSFNKVQKHVILWDGSIFFKVQPLTIGRLLCVFVGGWVAGWVGLGVGWLWVWVHVKMSHCTSTTTLY